MRRILASFALLALLGVAVWVLVTGKGPLAPFGRARTNVLLVSLDTLRADALGSYGYARAETPRLDALGAQGLRFEQATTVAPLTLPAHASLLTGTFPATHGGKRDIKIAVERLEDHETYWVVPVTPHLDLVIFDVEDGR